eukprot:3013007-Pleurochrysis_carterae.AAC.1
MNILTPDARRQTIRKNCTLPLTGRKTLRNITTLRASDTSGIRHTFSLSTLVSSLSLVWCFLAVSKIDYLQQSLLVQLWRELITVSHFEIGCHHKTIQVSGSGALAVSRFSCHTGHCLCLYASLGIPIDWLAGRL